MVLRRIFRPKRDEVAGDFRRLYNEEFHKLFSSPSIISMIKVRRFSLAVYVAGREIKGIPIVFWWEIRREKPLGRPRRRWVGNNKMYLREIGLGDIDWIDLAQDRDQ
jgi:hypothetical protein